MEFTDKVCVVTGGANGIGRCIAEAFLDHGAVVAVIDTDEVSDSRLKAKYGDALLFECGDVAKKDALEHFAKSVATGFGQVGASSKTRVSAGRGCSQTVDMMILTPCCALACWRRIT